MEVKPPIPQAETESYISKISKVNFDRKLVTLKRYELLFLEHIVAEKERLVETGTSGVQTL